jgi:protein-tyrosine phosphatase
MKKIDIHTHVLPGVDDGAGDWDTCLEMLKQSAESGVEAVIATPHYIPWKSNTAPDELQELCQKAKEKLFQKTGITMDIFAGHEIYYSVGVIDRLKEGAILTLAGSRHILVEFRTSVAYHIMSQAVQEFRQAGYVPIIAHVERYLSFQPSGMVQQLCENDMLIQVNASFFLRWQTAWKAMAMLKQEQIHLLGSDCHNLTKRKPNLGPALEQIREHGGMEALNRVIQYQADVIGM